MFCKTDLSTDDQIGESVEFFFNRDLLPSTDVHEQPFKEPTDVTHFLTVPLTHHTSHTSQTFNLTSNATSNSKLCGPVISEKRDQNSGARNA